MEISCFLVYSPNVCISQGWAKPKPGAWELKPDLPCEQQTWCASTGSWNWKCSQELEPSTLR